MDKEKIISLENLNQYSEETSGKIKEKISEHTSNGDVHVTTTDKSNWNGYASKIEQNKTDISQLFNITKGGNSLSGSTGYTVNDSVDYPLVGLKVFGKSTQDGTPTPENPVEIVSVVEPTVTVCGKNLSPINIGSSGGGFILETRIELDTETYYFSFNISTSNIVSLGVVYEGNTKYTNDVLVKDFKKVGRVGFAFTPTQKVTKIRIYMSGAGTFTDFQIEKGSTATAYEPYTAKSLTLPDTLNAIPVSSGGNVTIDGQEYIADYVDFGEGKYHRLVDPGKLDPTVSIVDNLDLLLASEEITDIPETEMQAYRQLQTYNGVTNIINDKGAGLSVEYCTNKMLAEYALPLIKDLEAENVKKDEEISVLKTDILNNENKITELQNENSLNEKVKFLNNMQRTGKVYTVRFPLWETSQTCDGEKLDDNAGLVCNPSTAVTRGISDYDDIPLFRTYDCNAYVDDNGVRHITALKGDSNFKDVGKVDVFVLGMSYYEKWWEADGYVYYSRTDMPKEGYTLAAECRTKDGTDQGFALYGKYMAGDIDGKPYSSKGLVPARYCSGRPAGSQSISYSGNITYFGQRGAHYSGTFMSEIKYITTSWWLKYGTRNSQSIMAGCTDYNAQYTATVVETGVKRIIVSNANAAYFEIGMPVSIGTGADRNAWACYNKAESAAITAIEAYDDNNKAIYVDVDNAFDTTTSTYITTFHWRSGFSDNVLGRDGCPCPTSAGLTNGKYPVVIQGIECFVGCCEVGSNAVMDIVDSTGKRDVYITNDSTKLTANIDTIKSTYTKIAEQIVPTSVGNWHYITAVNCNIENGIIVPTAAGQSGSSYTTGYADGLYFDGASSGQRGCQCFGNLGSGTHCGVSYLAAHSYLEYARWDVGCRLSVNG